VGIHSLNNAHVLSVEGDGGLRVQLYWVSRPTSAVARARSETALAMLIAIHAHPALSGADEAGPMVYAAAYCPISFKPTVETIGFDGASPPVSVSPPILLLFYPAAAADGVIDHRHISLRQPQNALWRSTESDAGLIHVQTPKPSHPKPANPSGKHSRLMLRYAIPPQLSRPRQYPPTCSGGCP
jgi:hypothetical protein